MYTRPLGFDASWPHALVFGQNNATDGERSNAFLYETEYRRDGNAVFARFEQAQKSGHELVLAPPLADPLYNLSAYTVGFVHDLAGTGLEGPSPGSARTSRSTPSPQR